MLEQLCHGDSSFITLTYSPEKVPANGSLVPKDLQDWLKRYRKACAPVRLRFYAVGEYGDQSQRPHYHIACFGIPGCSYGKTRNLPDPSTCCPGCNLVSTTWGKGRVFLGELTRTSAQYIAGYVVKKMTSKHDERLLGRLPEFSRSSNRPGIGAPAVETIISSLYQFNLDITQTDVPSALRHGKKILPLGRYMRRKLRIALGRDPNAPKEALEKFHHEMLLVLQDTIKSEDFVTVRELLQKRNAGKIASQETRSHIMRKRGNI